MFNFKLILNLATLLRLLEYNGHIHVCVWVCVRITHRRFYTYMFLAGRCELRMPLQAGLSFSLLTHWLALARMGSLLEAKVDTGCLFVSLDSILQTLFSVQEKSLRLVSYILASDRVRPSFPSLTR